MDIVFYNSGALKWDIVESWVDTQTMCSSIFDHIYPKFLLCNDKGWENTFYMCFHMTRWGIENKERSVKNFKILFRQ